MDTGPTTITTTPVPQQAAAKPEPPPVSEEDLSLQTLPNPNTQQSNNSTMLPTVLANTKEKTPMWLINELARYNKIQHQYRLTNEQGLSHEKRFTVILTLGTEEYKAEESSIKKAQHSAAAEALLNTNFKHPMQKPCKIMRDSVKRTLHVTQQLPLPGEIERTAAVPDLNTDLKSPISLVHEIALKRFLTVTFEVISEKGPPHMREFITVCRVGDLVTEAEGNGKKISKKRAAEKMLEKLSQLPPLPYVSERNPRIKRRRVIPKKKIRNLIKVNQDQPGADYSEDKNPFSKLVEMQQAKKQKEPTFRMIAAGGAPHRREVLVQVAVNGIIMVGTGPNKKVAKRAAAEILVDILNYPIPLPPPPPHH